MPDDPNAIGPFENGCHTWTGDSISMTISTHSNLWERMTAMFKKLDAHCNDPVQQPWRFKSQTEGYVPTPTEVSMWFRGQLKTWSGGLYRDACEELLKCSDSEDKAALVREFNGNEVATDLQNWLYREFKDWKQTHE